MIPILIGVAAAGLLVAMMLAPIEALGWWAGWYGEGLHRPSEDDSTPYAEIGSGKRARHYVVFLDGIAKVGGENYDDVQALLDGLSDALPDAVVLGDVMPYSVLNLGLTEGRPLARFWRLAHRFKREGRHPLVNFSINVRNLMQVLVAVDGRYGPIYGQGEAQVMLASLLRHGYVPGSGTPITLVGYSGGGQIALAAAPFLKRALGAPISLVSLAGVMRSDPGLAAVDHVHHLVGSRDPVAPLGAVLFPGRWRVFATSHWNRARRAGRLSRIEMGPMGHDGPGGYLDAASRLETGESFLEHTTAVLVGLVKRIDARARSAARPPARTGAGGSGVPATVPQR